MTEIRGWKVCAQVVSTASRLKLNHTLILDKGDYDRRCTNNVVSISVIHIIKTIDMYCKVCLIQND